MNQKLACNRKRVVITGLGAISPIGLNAKEFLVNLKNGKSGLGPLTRFNQPDLPVNRAYEVKRFDAKSHGVHLLDPFIQYAVAATHEAIDDSGLNLPELDPYEIGISVSSSKGGVHTLDRFGDRLKKRPSAILGARVYTSAVPNFAAQWIARRFKTKGPAKCYIAACATGTVAVAEGFRMVERGDIDICIAGASDASLAPTMLAGYHKMKALDPEALRPFHKDRKGFMVGEGAGILILESLEHAQKRGAQIYAELTGFGYASDGTNALHFQENENALVRALQNYRDQNLKGAEFIDYVNLHGTGTVPGDAYENQQLKQFFGADISKIKMSATKSMTGHMLGASGALEAVVCSLSISSDFIAPTVGLDNIDPAVEIDLTPNQSIEIPVNHAISISMGFGGHVAVIGMQRYS